MVGHNSGSNVRITRFKIALEGRDKLRFTLFNILDNSKYQYCRKTDNFKDR